MTDYLKEHASSLEDLWTPYLIHDSVITSWHAGPQPQAKDYDPTEEPYFCFEVDDPRFRDSERVFFTVTRKGVSVRDMFEVNKESYCEDYEMTHENCLKYVEQLPKPFHFYTN